MGERRLGADSFASSPERRNSLTTRFAEAGHAGMLDRAGHRPDEDGPLARSRRDLRRQGYSDTRHPGVVSEPLVERLAANCHSSGEHQHVVALGRINGPTKQPSNPVEQHATRPNVETDFVQSGSGNLGTWLTERRNVYEDYTRIFREPPDDPRVITLSIDSNDTRSEAESFIGPILFRAP